MMAEEVGRRLRVAVSDKIGERHALACRYKKEVPEGCRRSARRTQFRPREVQWGCSIRRVAVGIRFEPHLIESLHPTE